MPDPLSPAASLATSMHAQPGVYAVLLGSGVSSGAGIPTGWGVVSELVSRVAAASDAGNPRAGEVARADPEGWWVEHGEGELGYASLLERLAPTAAARQGILAGFFETTEDEQGEGLKQPTRAHRALAQLVKRGCVRVILTTNFDRLTERALDAEGIHPQVISRPEAVNGMMPLTHASATVIKLHGDYLDIGTRNTPTELADYPEEWKRLLAQVFDEYGLVISGWSAEWDQALVAALEAAPNRRYPLYWDSRSSRGENASRLLTARAGQVIPAAGADELFAGLAESVEALDRLSSPPLTTAMAVARLKRYLPDPVRRIDLHDLVMHEVDAVVDHVAAQPVQLYGGMTPSMLDQIYEGHFQAMATLLQLVIEGVRHDGDRQHDELWVDVLQRLLAVATGPTPANNDLLEGARRIPAFLALASIGMTAVARGRDGLLITLATEVSGSRRYSNDSPKPAAQALRYSRLTDERNWANRLPRWNGNQYRYPASHLFAAALRPSFTGLLSGDTEFEEAYHSFEYRLGLIQQRIGGTGAMAGEFLKDTVWDGGELMITRAEKTMRDQLIRGRAAAWETYFGGVEELSSALIAHREVLKPLDRG